MSQRYRETFTGRNFAAGICPACSEWEGNRGALSDLHPSNT